MFSSWGRSQAAPPPVAARLQRDARRRNEEARRRNLAMLARANPFVGWTSKTTSSTSTTPGEQLASSRRRLPVVLTLILGLIFGAAAVAVAFHARSQSETTPQMARAKATKKGAKGGISSPLASRLEQKHRKNVERMQVEGTRSNEQEQEPEPGWAHVGASPPPPPIPSEAATDSGYSSDPDRATAILYSPPSPPPAPDSLLELERTLSTMQSQSARLKKFQEGAVRTHTRRGPSTSNAIHRQVAGRIRSNEAATRSVAVAHAQQKIFTLPHRRRESWAHRQVRLQGGDATIEAHHHISGRPKAHDFRRVTEGKWAVYSATHGSRKAHASGTRPDAHAHMDVDDRHPLARRSRKTYMGCGPVHHRLGKC